MSQVIVEQDSLARRRSTTRDQEHKIETEAGHVKWQKTGTFGLVGIARATGILVLPIVAFWALLFAGLALMVAVLSQIFRLLGLLLGQRRQNTL